MNPKFKVIATNDQHKDLKVGDEISISLEEAKKIGLKGYGENPILEKIEDFTSYTKAEVPADQSGILTSDTVGKDADTDKDSKTKKK